ncbi:MAG: hypothetical protein H6835_14625 [Planctomycetes bacterium]|nr:hypothetical protein [Planctomycetota bacterium]
MPNEWPAGFAGIGTNHALLDEGLQAAVFRGTVQRAEQLLRRAAPELTESERRHEIAFVVDALRGLELVRAFGAGVEVCVDLHSDFATDAEASYHYGRRMFALCPQQFVVKIPLTPAGLLAAHRLVGDGVRVEVTHGFSVRQHELVARYVRPRFVGSVPGRVDAWFEKGGLPLAPGWCRPGALMTAVVQEMLGELPECVTKQVAATAHGSDTESTLAGVDVLSMPSLRAREAVDRRTDELQPLAGHPLLTSEVVAAAGADVFFRSESSTLVVAEQLAQRPAELLDAERVGAVLTDCQLPDLMPELLPVERRDLAAGGPVPVRELWQARVDTGELAWDGLLTEAALVASAVKQRQLDERLVEASRA